MATSLLSYFNETDSDQLKQQLLSQPNIQKLFTKLDADHVLVGAGVVYITKNLNVIRLREFQAVCRIRPIHVVIHEIPEGERSDIYATKLVQNSRESKLVGESVGTVLSCGAAVLGWLVVIGGGVAAPISGGTSTTVSVLAWGAAVASSLQCANGFIRTGSELGSGEINDYLDSQEWYQTAITSLDIISLAGAGSASLASFKAYQAVRSVSSRSLLDILKGMSRSERKRMTEEIIRINHPGVSNKKLKQMIQGGVYPKRYSKNR